MTARTRKFNSKPHEHVVSTEPRPGCGGKRCYESHPVAERMAKRTRRQHDTKVGPYKCPHCRFWHVGEL